jgi:predicted Zn-ribbon and HTH transcriptional regulator
MLDASMAGPRKPPVPKERSETLRKSLLEELGRGPLTARELSARVGLGEKEVAPHLEHLERSLRGRGEQLVVTPAKCMGCGHEFTDRRALTKPSRCPECRGERIEAPRFKVEASG